MRVAIAGGTGTLGRHVAEQLRSNGHDVRVLSRRAEDHPVDLTTGAGLDAALDGCDAVVDASNDTNAKRARVLLVDGNKRLLEAERVAGVKHHVCVSIIGCDQVPYGYYKTKCDQESVVEQGGVPWTIVRATQFHELIGSLFAVTTKAGIVPALRVPLQTVAAADVARALATVVEGEPHHGRYEVAGPEVLEVRDLARLWKRAKGSHAVGVRFPIPGKIGQALRSGGLTAQNPDERGQLTFAQWLAQ